MSTRPSQPDPVFLRSLTTLPLVGGSVALIGNPTAVDIEPTPVMLEAYSAWLHYERVCLNASFLPLTAHGRPSMAVPADNDGAYFHDGAVQAQGDLNDPEAWRRIGLDAQRRAALVLSTVGCSWNGKQVFGHVPPR